MPNMRNYLPFDGRPNNPRDIAITIAIGFASLWIVKKILREIAHSLFPSKLPGEDNTALLASPRTKNIAPTVEDLENVVSYDYIIVGTGSAGCVLANRLSANPNVKVLAIEAGHSDLKQLMSRVPAGFPQLLRTPADWSFRTTPQADCNGRKLEWPRGKMIGGCSSINAMMYTKGAPDDWDELGKLGNKGWSYQDIKTYLNKSEGFYQPNDGRRDIPAEDLAQHGQDGPWRTGYTAQAPINRVFPDACDSLGIKKVTDINTDKGMIGATSTQLFIDPKGQRSSTAVAFLTEDVIKRPNLKIASGQSVSRIIFDTSGAQPRAIGVEMAASKVTPIKYVAKATKEVILSAGAIGTPHLLKISGIGPAEELKKFDIPIVKDLSGVGENLIDHVVSHALVMKTDKKNSFHHIQSPIQSLPDVIEWFRTGKGPMSSQACDTFAWVRTPDMPDAPSSLKNKDNTSGKTSADVELLSLGVCFVDQGAFVAPLENGYGTLSVCGLRPESRGTITLATSDIFTPPTIDSKSLSTDYDLDVLVYGTRLAIKIAKSAPYKEYFQGWYMGPHHPIDWDSVTDAEIAAHIRKTCQTLYHPMGTAKMGSDNAAVVDDQLKVHGVQGLRIVDASVFPMPLACHPCAPVVAAAEKAADMILSAKA